MTSPDHLIRLRGPWQITVAAAREAGGNQHRVATVHMGRASNVLAELLPAGYAGRLRMERVFHRPSGLSAQSRVRLCIESNLSGHLIFNDHALGALAPGANSFDVSSFLGDRNRIQLDVLIDERDPMRQPEWDTRLEIFDRAEDA
jgi:hypothetical protein